MDDKPEERPAASDEPTRQPLSVPLKEEEVEVVVHKRPVVNAEVSIATRPDQTTEQVSDTVRRETVRLTRNGEAQVHEGGPAGPASP